MILIKPSISVMTVDDTPLDKRAGLQAIKFIERVARTCYKSEDKIGPDTAINFIRKIVARKHFPMLEFYDVVVRFTIDRGVSHELVRHRIASYAQESTRYCNYGKQGNVVFIIPPWVNVPEGEYSLKDFNIIHDTGGTDAETIWFRNMLDCEQDYLSLIKHGWSPQKARTVLPNSLKTELVAKYNLKEWRHVFDLRTAGDAHPQMIEVMRQVLALFRDTFPVVFDDIGVLTN